MPPAPPLPRKAEASVVIKAVPSAAAAASARIDLATMAFLLYRRCGGGPDPHPCRAPRRRLKRTGSGHVQNLIIRSCCVLSQKFGGVSIIYIMRQTASVRSQIEVDLIQRQQPSRNGIGWRLPDPPSAL